MVLKDVLTNFLTHGRISTRVLFSPDHEVKLVLVHPWHSQFMADESLRMDETCRRIADGIIAFLFLKMPVFRTHNVQVDKERLFVPFL
jgi:hypothetical protein